MGDLRSFFAAGKTAPIGNTLAGADSPNGGIRPFRPTRRSALGLFHPDRQLSGSSFFCHARHDLPPQRTRKIRLVRKSGDPENIVRPGNPPQLENQPARNIVRPGKSTSPGKSAGPTLIPPGTRPVRLCPAPLSFTGTFYAPFPSPQHVPRIAPPAEWHAP